MGSERFLSTEKVRRRVAVKQGHLTPRVLLFHFRKVEIGLNHEGEEISGESLAYLALGGLLDIFHDGVHGYVDATFGVGLGVEDTALGIIGRKKIDEVIDIVVFNAVVLQSALGYALADVLHLVGVELGVEEELVFEAGHRFRAGLQSFPRR